jgi:hypothetical protein
MFTNVIDSLEFNEKTMPFCNDIRLLKKYESNLHHRFKEDLKEMKNYSDINCELVLRINAFLVLDNIIFVS